MRMRMHHKEFTYTFKTRGAGTSASIKLFPTIITTAIIYLIFNVDHIVQPVHAKKSIPSTKQSYLYPTSTQWNPSPNIDEQGFLKQKYRRVIGDWEVEANIGGRYG